MSVIKSSAQTYLRSVTRPMAGSPAWFTSMIPSRCWLTERVWATIFRTRHSFRLPQQRNHHNPGKDDYRAEDTQTAKLFSKKLPACIGRNHYADFTDRASVCKR